MNDPVIGTKPCPVCQSRAIVRDRPATSGAPRFRCTACGAELRTRFTARALWALPLELLMLAAIYLVVAWLRGTSFASPGVVTIVAGGMIALSVGLTSRMALRALAFAKA